MKILKYILILGGAVLLGYWLLPENSPTSSASAESDTEVVYLCRESNELVKAPLQAVPAVNPKTGRATLYRALYCETCRKWRPVPPPQAFPGNPLTYPCPKHRRPMSPDGPLPNP